MIDDFIHDELGCVLLAERSPSNVPLKLTRSSPESALGALICPVSSMAGLHLRHLATVDEWVTELSANPVIEWWYSRLAGNTLYPGRFYYVPAVAMDDKYQEKSSIFLKKAGALFKWLRKSTTLTATEWGRERLGQRAAVKFSEGVIRLRQNPPGSRI